MLAKTITKNFKKMNLLTENSLFRFQKRNMMLLHEYQAQGLLKKNNIPIPKVK
jgi:hypothetical protein